MTTIFSFNLQTGHCHPSFLISFQTNGGRSTNEWVEVIKPIPTLKEFTACHWEKIRFMSSDIVSVWAYCIAYRNQLNDINCTQLYSKRTPETNFKQLTFVAEIYQQDSWIRIPFKVDNYRHRTWNHICWSYSSIQKMTKLYHNGKLIASESINDAPIILSNNEFKVTSIVLGQEPDSFNGQFSNTQLFNGELSEMNIWDTIVKDDEILSFGNCQKSMNGNILTWEEQWLKNHNAEINEISDTSNFCKVEKLYLIYPKRMSINMARSFCNAHGGNLAAPASFDENKKVMDIIIKHKDVCDDANPQNPDNAGKVAWLGLERIESEWYMTNSDGYPVAPKFLNWASGIYQRGVYSNYNENPCAFTNSEGKWGMEGETSCISIQLCAICIFHEYPVLNLIGLCPTSHFDFNYYIAMNNDHTINYYEGYKISNIVKKGKSWMFVSKTGKTFGANITRDIEDDFKDHFPLGRLDWNVYEPFCKMTSIEKKKLLLSKCNFGDQFTCNSGSCVDIKGRCNQINDCEDSSDEQDCELIKFPDSYKMVDPPKTLNVSEALNVHTFIKIESIDFIDTIKMQVGLTFDLHQKWNDSRLTFSNLNIEGTNRVRYKTRRQMWIPFYRISFSNALLGQVYRGSSEEMEIFALSDPFPMKSDDAAQNILYDGSRITTSFKKRLRISFKCTFELRYFPFDKQSCTFVLKMAYNNFNAAILKKHGQSVTYVGPATTKGFKILDTFAQTNISEKYSYFNFYIRLGRIYTDQLIATFFPTILLWFLAYFTLFIHHENFNERIMVATTVLLVLAALLDSIKDAIPSTSEFKYIDLWFLWYTSFIFLIALFHILLHQMSHKIKKNKIFVNGKESGVHEEIVMSKKKTLNELTKILMMIAFVLFNTLYFLLQAFL